MGSGCQIDTHSTTKHLSAEGRRKQYRSGELSSPVDQADFLKLRADDFLVERLHDVLVGTGRKRAGNASDIVLGGAEHDLRLFAVRHHAQVAQEFMPVHHRHVPVEQHGVGKDSLADFHGCHAVLGFDDFEIQVFQYSARNFEDHALIINHETCFHAALYFLI